MITQKTITTSGWTALTTVGQSATLWLDEDGDGAMGAVDIRVFHTTGVPTVDDLTAGKKVFKSNENNDLMVLIADNVNDVFYAMAKSGGGILSVDTI